MARLFGHEAQGRHAGLGIGFEDEQAVDAAVVIAVADGAAAAVRAGVAA